MSTNGPDNLLPEASWAALGLDAAMTNPERGRRASTITELRIKANAARQAYGQRGTRHEGDDE